MDKTKLRELMKEKRRKLDASFVEEASKAVCNLFLAEFKTAKRVLLYSSINNEVKTDELAFKLREKGVHVYLPKVEKGIIVTGPYSEELQTGAYGIKEPLVIDDRTDFDVVAVPGLAFDRGLNRLGYGGGYYDRLLPRLVKTIKTGLGYDFQIVSTVFRKSYDFPLDMLITEDYIYRRSR